MTTSQAQTARSCPVCGASAMIRCLEILQVPVLCNVLWATREAALQAQRGNIQLEFCMQCGHLFNLAFDPGRLSYTQGYENSLHCSPRFRHYARSLATQLIARYNLRGKNVLEIGCGQGDFLTLLCELGGNSGLGFAPSYTVAMPATPASAYVTFIPEAYADRHAHHAADLICCRQVLEHLPEPIAFLTMLRRSIDHRRHPVVFFEVPNALSTLRDLAIWDIIYEHCSYFGAASLEQAFTASGFAVQHLYETFAGQYLCLEARPGVCRATPTVPARAAVDAMAIDVHVFADKYRQKVADWSAHLAQLAAQGRRTVVWGAGSKGVTFLNVFQEYDLIEYVVDLNPRKHHMYVAGTGQQIVPPAFLDTYRPEVVIIMNPIYVSEIRECLAAMGLQPVCVCP